jgi:hypothetical protein
VGFQAPAQVDCIDSGEFFGMDPVLPAEPALRRDHDHARG